MLDEDILINIDSNLQIPTRERGFRALQNWKNPVEMGKYREQSGSQIFFRRDISMAFSTTGLVNTHVIFVFRHGKHLLY